MFTNRDDAALQLSLALHQYNDQNVLVIGTPCGGLESAYYLAGQLNAELGFIITQELVYPMNPDTTFGTLTEDGTQYVSPAARKHLSLEEIELLVEKGKRGMQRLITVFREENKFPCVYQRTVIITDDGTAPASTIQAMVDVCRRRVAHKIVVALPTASSRTEQSLLEVADDVVVLERFDLYNPREEEYAMLPKTTVETAMYLLKKWQQDHEVTLIQ